jgi:hypothetical protein
MNSTGFFKKEALTAARSNDGRELERMGFYLLMKYPIQNTMPSYSVAKRPNRLPFTNTAYHTF